MPIILKFEIELRFELVTSLPVKIVGYVKVGVRFSKLITDLLQLSMSLYRKEMPASREAYEFELERLSHNVNFTALPAGEIDHTPKGVRKRRGGGVRRVQLREYDGYS